jgi:hypothetical protein
MGSLQKLWKARGLAASSVTSNIASTAAARQVAAMRRVLIASTLLLLAGCATRPQPPQPVAPVPAPTPQVGVQRLQGMSTSDLVAHFGRPALQVREGTSLKLQFRGRSCVLDAYLYPNQTGVLRVTHVDTRAANGVDVDQASCIGELEYPS